MHWALNTYQMYVQDDLYGKPSEADEKIILLTAKLTQTKEKLRKTIKDLQGKGKATKGKDGEKKGGPKKHKKGGKGQYKGKGKGSGDKPDITKWKKPESNKLNQPRIVDGVSYYFCEEHDKWGKHQTDECNVRKKKQKEKKNKVETQANTTFLSALMDDDDLRFGNESDSE